MMKNGVIAMWVVLAAGLVFGGVFRTIFFVVLAIHGLEFLIFLPMLKKAPGTLGHHFVQTVIFGVAHYQEVQAALEGDGATS